MFKLPQVNPLIVKFVGSAVAIIISILLLCRPLSQDTILFSGDIGFVFSVAEGIVNRAELPLLGPSSHIGGRHLGAWYFYLVAFFYYVTEQSIIMTVYAMIAVKVIGLFIPLYLFCNKIFPQKNDYTATILSASVLLMTCCNQQFFPLRVPWHGADLVIGSGILMTGVYFGFFHRCFGVFLFLASMAIQLHFGFAASVVGFVLCGIMQRKNIPTSCHYLLPDRICFILSAISWIPLFIFIVQYPTASPFASISSGHIHKPENFFQVYCSNIQTLLNQIQFAIGIKSSLGLVLWFLSLASFVVLAKIRKSDFKAYASFTTFLSLILIPIIFTLITASILGQRLDPYVWYTSYCSFVIWWVMPVLILSFLTHAVTTLKKILLLVLILIVGIRVVFESTSNYPLQFNVLKTIPVSKSISVIVSNESKIYSKLFSVKGRGGVAGTEGAIYFFLGPKYYPFHDASNRFMELSSFKGRKDLDKNKIIITDQGIIEEMDLRPWLRRGWTIAGMGSTSNSIEVSPIVGQGPLVLLNKVLLQKEQ